MLLPEFQRHVVDSCASIEQWFRQQFLASPPPFYCSVDIRNNGRKIAAIDTNLFPAGFNNLSPSSFAIASESFKRQIFHLCPSAKRLLLIPEGHTRNKGYIDNLFILRRLLRGAGIDVLALGIGINAATTLTSSAQDETLQIDPLAGNERLLESFSPCFVLLNNDLSATPPAELANLEIPISPPLQLGWHARRKSTHFHHYEQVARELAQCIGVDAELMSAQFALCDHLDFTTQEGLDCLAVAVDETLRQFARGEGGDDYVVLKANSGTYGMGVMIAHGADEVRSFNRKQRNKMAVVKDGLRVQSVLIQEGIRTVDTVENAAAEPVVYLVGDSVIGGFYRYNRSRTDKENLNSAGADFFALPYNVTHYDSVCAGGDENDIRWYVYGVIARMGALAAAREIAAATP